MEEGFKRRVLLSAGMLLAVFAFFWILFYILSGILDSKTNTVVAKRQTIAERTYALDNFSSLKAKNAQADLYMQRISAFMPTQDSLLDLPSFFEGLGRIHNVSTNFSFNGPPVSSQNKQPGYANFVLGVSGQLSDIRDFVSDMEFRASRFLINLDSVDITAGGGGYNADIHGKVYFQ